MSTPKKPKPTQPQSRGAAARPGGSAVGVKHTPAGAGWIVEPLQLTMADLSELPKRYREHPRAGEFLAAVSGIATFARERRRLDAEDDGLPTAAAIRDGLDKIAVSLRGARPAVEALFQACGLYDEPVERSALYEALSGHAGYVIFRNEQCSVGQPDRPEVPPLPEGTPALPFLLERLSADMLALRTLCEFAAGKIQPEKSSVRSTERELAASLVMAFREAFGSSPPKSSGFIAFVAHVARLSELPAIGRVMVEEAIDTA
ncbi:MAG: hypothetical protein EPO12_18285 [Aquabacterium sp.]|nr:MAG: hypothetical protein EPO12_18285 [Aquabacterium sp.]